MLKKIYIILLLLIANDLAAQSKSETVVAAFGRALSLWCATGDICYRAEIEELCSGTKKCRVEDKMLANYMYETAGVRNETFCIDSYLNMFDDKKHNHIKTTFSNICECKRSLDAYGHPINFVTAEIKFESAESLNKCQKIFLLRNGKISGIYSCSGQRSFGHLNASLVNGLKVAEVVRIDGFNGVYDKGYSIFENKLGKRGLIDINGTVCIPGCYEQILSDDSPWKKCVHKVSSDQWYYEVRDIRTGKIVDGIIDFKPFKLADEIIVAKGENNLWGYIGASGAFITDFIFEDAENVNEGYAYVKYQGKGFILESSVLDRFNQRVSDGQLSLLTNLASFADNDDYSILSGFKDGLAKINNVKYGFINNLGEEIVPCIYDQVTNKLNDGMVRVRVGRNEGMLDANGNVLIPLDYDILYPFDIDGIAAAVKDGLFGYIDIRNRVVLPFDYGFLWSSPDGKTVVPARSAESRKWGLVDIRNPRNRYLCEFKYDQLIDCGNGLFLAKYGNKYGYINSKSFEEIPIVYDYASDFDEGLACVGINENGVMKYGAINIEGVPVIDLEYDQPFSFFDGVAPIVKNGKMGVIDSFGHELLF